MSAQQPNQEPPGKQEDNQQQAAVSSGSGLADKISGRFLDQPAPPPGVKFPEVPASPQVSTPPSETPAMEVVNKQEVPQPPWITGAPKQEEAISSKTPSPKIPSEKMSSPPLPPPLTTGGEPPPPEVPSDKPTGGEAVIEESPFKKIIPLVGGGAIVILILLLIFKVILPKFRGVQKPESKKEVSLTYWGLWESESVFTEVIAGFEKDYPNVKINYSQQSPKDYRERLQSALAKGDGPDIFRFHNTWVPMLKNDLAPAPTKTAAAINLSGSYFPVIAKDLKVGATTYGVPLYFDSLALFYNTKIFQEASKSPPTSWEELRKTALDLTVKDDKGKIQVSGVALGTTGNVEHFSDILGLMMFQNGADLNKPNDTYASDALTFYTLFTTQDHVWDETLPSSIYAFAMGKVAMIFAPSWRAFEIKEINPNFDFKIVPVPQLPGTQVAWATYWVEGVSKKSKNTEVAWEFLQYLSSKESLTKLYTTESGLRAFGEPYPRTDLASQLETDPLAGAFVKQGTYAKSWYLCSRTHDNGLNDRMIKYFEDAVNLVVTKKVASQKALEPTAQGVTQVLTQYGISSGQ